MEYNDFIWHERSCAAKLVASLAFPLRFERSRTECMKRADFRVLRAREVMINDLYGFDDNKRDLESLQRYFDVYAVTANRRRRELRKSLNSETIHPTHTNHVERNTLQSG